IITAKESEACSVSATRSRGERSRFPRGISAFGDVALALHDIVFEKRADLFALEGGTAVPAARWEDPRRGDPFWGLGPQTGGGASGQLCWAGRGPSPRQAMYRCARGAMGGPVHRRSSRRRWGKCRAPVRFGRPA